MIFKVHQLWIKWCVFFFFAANTVYAGEIFFREDFNNLENWRPFYFKEAAKHSSYTIQSYPENNYLKAESNDSISSILLKKEFDVYKYPIVQWRWRVENIYKNGDTKKKSGDDSPLRFYILFKYDPEKAGFWQRLKYNSIRLIYGEYPPLSCLCYLWANKEHQEDILTSTRVNKIKLLLLEKGGQNVGKWLTEEVNIVEDYRRAFGGSAPQMASIGITNDSDNTEENSVSFIDFIQVQASEKKFECPESSPDQDKKVLNKTRDITVTKTTDF